MTKKKIIFRHAETFRRFFFQRNSFCEENEASFEIFWNIIFVEMKILKLNNYSAKACWTCYSTMVYWKKINLSLAYIWKHNSNILHATPDIKDVNLIYGFHLFLTQWYPHQRIENIEFKPLSKIIFHPILFWKSTLTKSCARWNEKYLCHRLTNVGQATKKTHVKSKMLKRPRLISQCYVYYSDHQKIE